MVADNGKSEDESEEADQETVEQVQQPTDPQIFDYIQEFGKQIASVRERPLLYLLYPSGGMIQETNSIRLYQEFLERGKLENLDIVLHSNGGNLHEAYDMIKLCRNYTKGEVTVFVPMKAMSAATLVSLGADQVVLSETGKLGPLDPQIPHPERGQYMPVRSVTNIPEVLEKALATDSGDVPIEVKGESIIKPIAEQVDPYFLTEHEKTADLAREYGQKLLSQRGVSEQHAGRCLDYLIEYPTHSFSVDLQEIRTTPDLSNVIKATGVKSLEYGEGIERWLMYMLNFFLHWDYKYLGRGEPKMEPRMGILEPIDDEQTTLEGDGNQAQNEAEGDDDDAASTSEQEEDIGEENTDSEIVGEGQESGDEENDSSN